MSPGAGADQFESEVKNTVRDFESEASARADIALNIMRNVAMEVLGHNGGGRVYRGHVASAPGQPPAPDTGSLRANWSRQKIIMGGGGLMRITLRLRSNMFYSIFQDPGTRYIAQRPFFKPIEQKSMPKIAALFASI